MSELRRIEITEERLLDGEAEYFEGDIKSFPVAKANAWIEYGWAKDAETGEQGERVPGARAAIEPDRVVTPAS